MPRRCGRSPIASCALKPYNSSRFSDALQFTRRQGKEIIMQQHHVTQLASGEGRAVHMSGDTYTFKAVGETSDGMLTLFEAIIPPGGGPPPHIHHREIEYYYLLEGELEIMDGDETFMAHAGAFITIPKGAL